MIATPPAAAGARIEENPLSHAELQVMDAWWRAANYLSVGQIYLLDNPLLKEPGIDSSKFHVVFLSETPAPEAIKKLESITVLPDKVRHVGEEIYFYFPNGVSGSSIWKHNLDRVLSVSGTMRNWNTVTTLYTMATECG